MKVRNREVKKIAYITGSRADFGLMTTILHAINKSPRFTLQIYATGIHLMPEFGNTIQEVKKEFPNIIAISATFDSDNRTGMAKFSGDFIQKLVRAFTANRPDFVLVLGDRVEMLSTALVCLYLGIPVGHIHGGDKTETVDDSSRHAITKLSQVHFAATKEAAKRLVKMGESKKRIYVVGAPALDIVLNAKLPSRAQLFRHLKLDPTKPLLLVTQHPVSDYVEQAGKHMAETLAAVKSFKLPVVVVYPHADAGGRKIIAAIRKEKTNPLFHIFPSLPFKQFLALEREVAVWVGNSSGAMIESATFKIPVVQVGTRQAGRVHGHNVLTVGYNRNQIIQAIKRSLYNSAYRKQLTQVKNPWSDGYTAKRVVTILEKLELDSQLLKKQLTY